MSVLTMGWLRELRKFFVVRPDPYAGGDFANAQRLGGILWVLLLVLSIGLLPVSPPTEELGDAGWVLAGGIVAGAGAIAYAQWRKLIPSWAALLGISYLTVFAIAAMQWLAGGVGAPYDRLLLLPTVFVSAIHPPRRIVAFLGFVLLALAAPLVYDAWDAEAAGASGAGFVIWCALALTVSVLMSGVRAQRLAHAREEAEAREEARLDSLTGLYNRRAFEEALEVEIDRSRRLDVPLSVAMIDIDNFKEINDRWGYAEGDRCLRELAAALSSSVRQHDLSFRWGGDEFAVILAGTTAEDAGPIGERFSSAARESCHRPDDEPITIRFAVAELGEGMTAAELASMAGMALVGARVGAR